ncbi:MAG: hypothetical protein DMD62_05080 [Gemmatimonadetes bacterium]|nr:MAG: hypothetical protein DMD62_05080 [Gemmatimonadota bacterium]
MRYFFLLMFVCAILASCGSPLGLPPAFIANTVDTVHLYALSGTPVTLPSGYVISGRLVVRTDVYPLFDFVFDIDTAGRAIFLPTGAVKMGRNSGLQIVPVPFDSIHTALLANYNKDSATVVHENDVVMGQSIPTTCSFSLPAAYYAKMHILKIDTTAAIDTTTGLYGRRIDFEILANVNCGYRGLDPGLPKH